MRGRNSFARAPGVTLARTVGYFGRCFLMDRLLEVLSNAAMRAELGLLVEEDCLLGRTEDSTRFAVLCIRSALPGAVYNLKLTVTLFDDVPTVIPPPLESVVLTPEHHELVPMEGRECIYTCFWDLKTLPLLRVIDEIVTMIRTRAGRLGFASHYSVNGVIQSVSHEYVNTRWKTVIGMASPTAWVPARPPLAHSTRCGTADRHALQNFLENCLEHVKEINSEVDPMMIHTMVAMSGSNPLPWSYRNVLYPPHMTADEMSSQCDFRIKFNIGIAGTLFDRVGLDFFPVNHIGYGDHRPLSYIRSRNTRFIFDGTPNIVRRMVITVLNISVLLLCHKIPLPHRHVYCLSWRGYYHTDIDNMQTTAGSTGLMAQIAFLQDMGWKMYAEYILRERIGEESWYRLVTWLLKDPPTPAPLSVRLAKKRKLVE
jgi:hypothetical protein